MARAQELDNYFDIPPESQGLDYNKYLLRGKSQKKMLNYNSYTSANSAADVTAVSALLRTFLKYNRTRDMKDHYCICLV